MSARSEERQILYTIAPEHFNLFLKNIPRELDGHSLQDSALNLQISRCGVCYKTLGLHVSETGHLCRLFLFSQFKLYGLCRGDRESATDMGTAPRRRIP